jgi:DNA polymerase-3 subunit delta
MVKLNAYDADSITKELDTKKFLLLYGPDVGFIDEVFLAIKSMFNAKSSVISFDELTEENFYKLFTNKTLFDRSNKIYKIINTPNSMPDFLKSFFKKETNDIFVFVASDLSKNSSVKNFFENSKEALSVCVYNPTEIGKNKIINLFFKTNKIPIVIDAIDFLKENLSGNRLYIKNELMKIALYSKHKDYITKESASLALFKNFNAEGEKVAYALLRSDIKFFTLVAELANQSIPYIWIIRAIQRFLLNLYHIKSHKSNALKAIKDLKIHFSTEFMYKELLNLINFDIIYSLMKDITTLDVEFRLGHADVENKFDLLFFKYLNYKI